LTLLVSALLPSKPSIALDQPEKVEKTALVINKKLEPKALSKTFTKFQNLHLKG
jgi:hypothetical protein